MTSPGEAASARAAGPRQPPGVVQIDRDVRLGDLETALAKLRNSPGSDLLLAYKLKHRGLLVTASVCQLVATWAATGSGRLRTHWGGGEYLDKEVYHLVHSDQGLVAVLAASDVMDRLGQRSVAADFTELALKRLADMDSLPLDELKAGLGKGRHSFLLLCDDQHGTALPRSLYERPHGLWQPRDENGFRTLAGNILRLRLKPHHATPVLKDLGQEATLGVLLRELFWNADEWGRRDADGRTVTTSLRFIRAEWHEGGLEKLKVEDHREPRVIRWLDQVSHHSSTVLELSVLDAGPGITARRLRGLDPKIVTAEQELEALVDCLQRGYTSAANRAGRGEGLDAALEALTEMKGLLRIRSGRLDVYCDTAEAPYRGMPLLRDWHTASQTPSIKEPVVGTLISMLLPLTGLPAHA